MKFSLNICQIILLFFSAAAFAQKGLIHYNVNNGLSQNSVTCIYRDQQGIVWIGTQDGLNKFDGYHFRIFKHDDRDSNTISDQFILSIHEDGGNNLIVGTRNGLNLFDKRKETFTNISPDKKRLKEVQYHFPKIQRLENGNLIFLAGEDIYEWQWRKKDFRKLINYVSPGIHFSGWNNEYIQLDHQKNIFSPSGSFKKEREKSTGYKSKIIRLNQFVDRNELVWLTERMGGNIVISFYDLKNRRWRKNTMTVPSAVNHIYFDKNNYAWISTDKGILISNDQENLQPLSINGEPVRGEVQCTFTDEEGLTWIGFTNNGIGLYNPEVKAYHLFSTGLSNDPAFSSLAMSNGDVYVAANSGLYQFDKERRQKKITRDYCISMTMDRQENLWVGTANEGIFLLNRYGIKSGELNKSNSMLATNQIFHLQYDSLHQRLLASTPLGFFIYDMISGVSQLFLENDNKIAGNYVLHSFVDSRGNTWISSNKGVDVYDANLTFVRRIRSDKSQDPIKKTIITSCSEDQRGNIWISTLSSGVYRYDGKTLRQYEIGNGLSSNYCYGVISDRKNRIWITTTSGISVLNPDNDKVYRLTEQNALPTVDYSIGSLQRASNGMLYTGSPEGVIEIDPSSVSFNEKYYRPIISNVMVDNLPAVVDSVYSLPSDCHQISFEFVAPCYINAGKLHYQYRIKGINKAWINVEPDNRVLNLVELPFRPVIVEIRAAISKTSLADAPVTRVSIYRQSPLWRKPYMIVGEIFMLILSLYALIRYILKKRISQKIKEVEMMESIYKERERISRDLHDHLGAYAAAIKSNIIQAEKENAGELPFQQLKENADGMVSSLRETIWALQHEHISITNISDRFKNSVNRLGANYPDTAIEISEDIRQDKILSPAESIQLVRIMQEALTNALKHGGGKHVSIHIHSDDLLTINISDDGKGFDKEFGINGYGIRNMEERAREAGFDLRIDSSEAGTMVGIKKY